jgi:hypothetical protein
MLGNFESKIIKELKMTRAEDNSEPKIGGGVSFESLVLKKIQEAEERWIESEQYEKLNGIKKMSNLGEYGYNKFTEDSSDDYPKYADGISIENSKEVFITASKSLEGEETIKGSKSTLKLPQEALKIGEALSHVLTLASESTSHIICAELHSKSIESIKTVKKLLYNYQNSNIVLSKDSDNK